MDAFIWDERFFTGLATIDAQHKGLVDRINSMGEAITRGGDFSRAALEELFEALADYAGGHFGHEEALMHNARVDPREIESHHAKHANFMIEVMILRRAAQQPGPGSETAARTLMTFLVSWLAFHILGVDRLLAKQIALIESGDTPAEAYDRVARGEDSSTRLVLNSVDNLLAVIVTRNRELSELNASLEQRVADRTIEINARVEELEAALEHVRTLQGIIPICMHCHQIRNDTDSWQQIEHYIAEHSEAKFSHGICPTCFAKHYPE